MNKKCRKFWGNSRELLGVAIKPLIAESISNLVILSGKLEMVYKISFAVFPSVVKIF